MSKAVNLVERFKKLLGSPRDNVALAAELDAKQDLLVSGTNIKTVNSTSLLGSGNIVITGGGTTLILDGGTASSTFTGTSGLDLGGA